MTISHKILIVSLACSQMDRANPWKRQKDMGRIEETVAFWKSDRVESIVCRINKIDDILVYLNT